jgi:UDP-N-acetylmuramate-alanine ligase
LLTSVSWDHADLYPTEASYFNTFKKLISEIPASGKIIVCNDNEGIKKVLSAPATTYGKTDAADYFYHSVQHTKNGLDFVISHKGQNFKIHSPMLGRFNVENITGAFAMAHSVGISADKIVAAISAFKGIKRRLEKRFEGDSTLLDCHAPTAEKALSVLESIREVYSQKIIAVYEPNIGGRQRASAGMYDNALASADLVVIPRLTKLKVAEGAPESEIAMEGQELADAIAKTHKNVKYIDDDSKLVEFVLSETKKGDVVAFLGSHGFRGMIEEISAKLS